MKKIVFLMFLPICLFAQKGEKWFNVTATLKLGKGMDKAYLRYRKGADVVVDSSRENHGTFLFEGKIEETVVADLRVTFSGKEGQSSPEPEDMQFVLAPGKTLITAKDSLGNHTVSGSPANTDLEKLNKEQAVYDARANQLYPEYSQAQANNDQETLRRIQKQVDSIYNAMRENVYYAYLKQNPNSVLAVYALRQYVGYIIDPVKADAAFSLLPADHQNWPSAKELKARINAARNTAVGSFALDFTQNDTLGHPVSLSSFKGKYLLLDFWASWCHPCRMENPRLVHTFNEFKDKNFTVLSVSLDRPGQKERWLKAIHDDGLAWTHVSDLKYWNNAVALQYSINEIPQNLLIDPQGKIIAKNLMGQELEQKLKELLR